AFFSCRALTFIAIPKSVTSIGERAFHFCMALTDIYFGGVVTEWEELPKGDIWDGRLEGYTVHFGGGQ
ncbi:MAG: leucine-rich repeat protein, partial [Clostridia bacterium]|nr:leucine-rich repeat protein [Clostridia bacterium]